MRENLKRYISRIKIRTIRTFHTILGFQNKKSVQSVHFGHPCNYHKHQTFPKLHFSDFNQLKKKPVGYFHEKFGAFMEKKII